MLDHILKLMLDYQMVSTCLPHRSKIPIGSNRWCTAAFNCGLINSLVLLYYPQESERQVYGILLLMVASSAATVMPPDVMLRTIILLIEKAFL